MRRSEASAIGGVGVFRDKVRLPIGKRDDISHRVGMVADNVGGGVQAIAEVRAVDIPGSDSAAGVEVAQDTFHAAHERQDVARDYAGHLFRDAAAQGVVAVDDLFAGAAAFPVNAGGTVVFVVSKGPRLAIVSGIGHVVAGVVPVGDSRQAIADGGSVFDLTVDEGPAGSVACGFIGE